MIFTETIKESFRSLTSNKMRTLLSTLGIVIGIASVIALISVGNAAQTEVISQIESFGVNTINIMSMSRGSNQQTLSLKDVEMLRDPLYSTYIKTVVPKVQTSGQLSYEDESYSGTVVGTDDSYFELKPDTIQVGQVFSTTHYDEAQRVLVIGQTVAEELFDSAQAAVGQRIKFDNQYWQVIGVFKEGTNDTQAYAPLSSLDQYIYTVSSDELSTIEVTTPNSEISQESQNLIKYLFMQLWDIDHPDNLGLMLMSSQQMVEAMDEILGIFTTLLAGIAAISLLVGGIGIMNIMLVTVTERTREIGLRKALGAQNKIIILQFLVESTTLAIVGGILGFIVGLLLGLLLTKIMGVTFAISWGAVIMAVGVSTAIGVIFGIYPAQKAAKLQPIEALRYD